MIFEYTLESGKTRTTFSHVANNIKSKQNTTITSWCKLHKMDACSHNPFLIKMNCPHESSENIYVLKRIPLHLKAEILSNKHDTNKKKTLV